jgi:hypothetical protein
MARRCFVISPIGAAGSPVREHADDVFEFIIKPAMEELAIHVYRSDHNQEIGRVTDQMIGSIMGDDLCIAVITFHNPNVFYELAIAQCAARPVIILVEKGQSIPFDLKDLRVVEYDLRPRPLRDGVYSRQIVNLVRNLEAADWAVDVPFGKGLSPLGGKGDDLKYHEKIESYETSERWLGLLSRATHSFDLSGMSLRWWTKFSGLGTSLRRKADGGCQIRILLMDPENPALPQLINRHIKIGGVGHLAEEVRGTYAFYSELAAQHPNIRVRRVREGCLTHQVVRSDCELLVALLLYSQGTSQMPLFECSSSSPLFQTIASEFDTLWVTNAPADAPPEARNGPDCPDSAAMPKPDAILPSSTDRTE